MADRIIRMSELSKMIGLSESTIYDRLDPNSRRYSPDFPKQKDLGGKAVGWRLSEVEAWMNRRQQSKSQQKNSESIDKSGKTEKSSPKTFGTLPSPRPSDAIQQAVNVISLAQTITKGQSVNARLQEYLRWPLWTPAVGCLLIAGIAPEINVSVIPAENGTGIDGKPLHASNKRFHTARYLLRQWSEQEGDVPDSTDPVAFLQWCCDEEIQSEWLELFIDQRSITDTQDDITTASRLAALLSGKSK